MNLKVHCIRFAYYKAMLGEPENGMQQAIINNYLYAKNDSKQEP